MSYEQPPAAPTGPADESPVAAADPAPSYAQPPDEVDPDPVTPPYAGYQPVHVLIGSQRSGIAATRAVGVMGRIIGGMVLLPIIGGVVAGFARDASDSVPDLPSFTAPEPVLGSPDRPLPVVEGRRFVLDGLVYRVGWKVAGNAVDFATVTGLRATNPTAATIHPAIRLRLLRGGVVAATVTCVSAGIDPRATADVLCGGADELPARYDSITASTLF